MIRLENYVRYKATIHRTAKEYFNNMWAKKFALEISFHGSRYSVSLLFIESIVQYSRIYQLYSECNRNLLSNLFLWFANGEKLFYTRNSFKSLQWRSFTQITLLASYKFTIFLIFWYDIDTRERHKYIWYERKI